MSERANELVQALLALSLEERDEVVRQLWERREEDLPPFPEVNEEEEHAELLRRLESIENGTADAIPFDEAMTRIRSELERRQQARDAAMR